MKAVSAVMGVLTPLLRQSNSRLEVVKLNTSSHITILKASATLVLPGTPPPITGALAFWSAINLDKDFVQRVTDNSPPSLSYCTISEETGVTSHMR
jgi:hypothetical protein